MVLPQARAARGNGVTNDTILALLKFSGALVALASALWSTTQKITYEGADGARRLTLQGRVMIGIVLLSGLVSLLALGFESLLREEQAQLKQREAAETAAHNGRLAQARAQQELRRQTEAATTQAKLAANFQAEALADQQHFLEQSFQIAAAAAEQQRRDAQISMQIAREANKRLGEAERTLAEFERINYPLREIEAGVELELNLAGLGPEWRLDALWTAVKERWEALDAGTRRRTDTIFLDRDEFWKITRVPHFRYATQGTRVALAFVIAEKTMPAPGPDGMAPVAARPQFGRESISFALEFGGVRADLSSRTLRASYSGTYRPPVEGVVQSGQKLSLSDVNRLVPVLTIDRLAERRYPRRPDTLVDVSFRLNDRGRFDASPDLPIAGATAFVLFPPASP